MVNAKMRASGFARSIPQAIIWNEPCWSEGKFRKRNYKWWM